LRAQSKLESDAAAFRLDSTHEQVEVYYGVLQRGLNFTQVGNAWEAPLHARVELWQNGKAIEHRDISQTIHYEVTKAQLDSISANKLIGATGFSVPYSDNLYAAFIWQTEKPNVADTIRSERLVLPPPGGDQPQFSGIELGSNVAPANGQSSPFEKVGYIFTPNPQAVYGENYTKLYYYTELYIPKTMIDSTQSLTITTRILDATGKQIVAHSEKQSLSRSIIPMIVGLDIDGLMQDRYKLEVQAKEGEGVVARQEKTFFYVSGMQISEEAPTAAAVSTDELFAASPFASMSDAAADELIQQSLYLGTETDRKLSDKLKTVEAKRKWLFEFWMAKDPAGSAPLSAFNVYQARLKEVADKYSYQRTPGWKSGRGRIYLMYGPPTEVEKHLFDAESKPYLIWRYDPTESVRLNSGTKPEFIFVDRQGGGNFWLVNSNVVGEASDPDWYNTEVHRLAH
jgi:GWxTD domain-containing protein